MRLFERRFLYHELLPVYHLSSFIIQAEQPRPPETFIAVSDEAPLPISGNCFFILFEHGFVHYNALSFVTPRGL